MIDPQDPYRRRFQRVLARKVAYVDEGSGPTVLFLHGTGTSSYFWRIVIRYLSRSHRCIAPDWPGMGASERRVPSGRGTYTFFDRRLDLDSFVDLLDLRGVVVVGHEMGGMHALDWARRHPSRTRGIVLVEGASGVANADALPEQARDLLLALRSDDGEDLALRQNAIIERYVPLLIQRRLSPLEMDRYRAPFELGGETRRAPLTMLRELPIKQHAGEVDDQAEELGMWASETHIPKLVIGGDPGFITPPSVLEDCDGWRATTTTSVPGIHYLMEDSPERITSALRDWLAALPL